jgi:hypothetical protein
MEFLRLGKKGVIKMRFMMKIKIVYCTLSIRRIYKYYQAEEGRMTSK